jgi:hypothetical protein
MLPEIVHSSLSGVAAAWLTKKREKAEKLTPDFTPYCRQQQRLRRVLAVITQGWVAQRMIDRGRPADV